jgi:hypothetical protein
MVRGGISELGIVSMKRTTRKPPYANKTAIGEGGDKIRVFADKY